MVMDQDVGTKSIKAYFGGKPIGTIKWLSYNIVKKMASTFPDSHPQRSYNGSLEWEQFDTEPFIDKSKPFIYDVSPGLDDLRPDSDENVGFWYPDQIPPFDVQITYTNGCECWLYGVELIWIWYEYR